MNPGIFSEKDIKLMKELLRQRKTYEEINEYFPKASLRQIEYHGLKLKRQMGLRVRPFRMPVPDTVNHLEARLDFTADNMEVGRL